MDDQQIKLFKECFKRVSVKELKDRIERFKNHVNLQTISEEALRKELFQLFSFDHEGSRLSFFLKSETLTRAYDKFYFYRVRKFVQNDLKNIETKHFSSIKTEQDIWARPNADVINFGRLNTIGESVLYAAGQVTNALYETDCKEDDYFFLLVYENKRQMRLSQIHLNSYFEEFDELENAKQTILHNFLLNEFTKVVNPRSEFLYKSSINIYKQFFQSQLIDAFTYPSIKTPKNYGYNICFSYEKAKEVLNFCGVMVCKLADAQANNSFTILPYYDGFLNESGKFDFYKYNSDESRLKFGNFNSIRSTGLL